jgi:hypothetical protein
MSLSPPLPDVPPVALPPLAVAFPPLAVAFPPLPVAFPPAPPEAVAS